MQMLYIEYATREKSVKTGKFILKLPLKSQILSGQTWQHDNHYDFEMSKHNCNTEASVLMCYFKVVG